MGFFSGITRIVLTPVAIVDEVLNDVTGKNGEESQTVSILTTGISSAVKGTVRNVARGLEDMTDGV